MIIANQSVHYFLFLFWRLGVVLSFLWEVPFPCCFMHACSWQYNSRWMFFLNWSAFIWMLSFKWCLNVVYHKMYVHMSCLTSTLYRPTYRHQNPCALFLCATDTTLTSKDFTPINFIVRPHFPFTITNMICCLNDIYRFDVFCLFVSLSDDCLCIYSVTKRWVILMRFYKIIDSDWNTFIFFISFMSFISLCYDSHATIFFNNPAKTCRFLAVFALLLFLKLYLVKVKH